MLQIFQFDFNFLLSNIYSKPELHVVATGVTDRTNFQAFHWNAFLVTKAGAKVFSGNSRPVNHVLKLGKLELKLINKV